jgi:hypothetical protein
VQCVALLREFAGEVPRRVDVALILFGRAPQEGGDKSVRADRTTADLHATVGKVGINVERRNEGSGGGCELGECSVAVWHAGRDEDAQFGGVGANVRVLEEVARVCVVDECCSGGRCQDVHVVEVRQNDEVDAVDEVQRARDLLRRGACHDGVRDRECGRRGAVALLHATRRLEVLGAAGRAEVDER